MPSQKEKRLPNGAIQTSFRFIPLRKEQRKKTGQDNLALPSQPTTTQNASLSDPRVSSQEASQSASYSTLSDIKFAELYLNFCLFGKHLLASVQEEQYAHPQSSHSNHSFNRRF